MAFTDIPRFVGLRPTCAASTSGPCANDIVDRGSSSFHPWLIFVYGRKAALHQVGWHRLRLALHQALFQGQCQPLGQRPNHQVTMQITRYTLPRASQDLVASFASSAISRHSRVSDKLKQKFRPGNTLVFLRYCLIPHHKAILRQLGQAMTTRPPWSVSSIGQGAALCHLTNGCKFKKIICLFFSFSRTTCEIHTICSCTPRQFVHCMRKVRTSSRMTRQSGHCVRPTTGDGNRLAGTCG